MPHILASLFALALLFGQAASAGVIYKCKNLQGTLLYQEKPCTEEAESVSSWSISSESKMLDNEGESSTGSLVLGQGNNGHYFVDGSINDQFLNFVIDTGATTVALPEAVAKAAGLRCLKKINSRTANGISSVCTTVIQKFKFGSFTLLDVDAIIAPNLGQPLLGMNVLKRFRVEQENGQMRFSKKY